VGETLPAVGVAASISGDFMKPELPARKAELELFQQELVNLLDQRHALFKLTDRINWSAAVERFGPRYADEGRPGVPLRLMVGLYYLKHAFNRSDEQVVERWVENPYW
jgi:transposase, IS5 family